MRAKHLKNTLVRHIILIMLWNYNAWAWRGRALLEAFLYRAAWLLARGERRLALAQLEWVYPQWTQARRVTLLRACTRHLARALVEALELRRLGGETLEKVVFAGDGDARLDAAVRQGRGVVIATGHIGNWELMAAAIARRWPTCTIVRRSYDPELHRLVEAFRHGYGIATIARDAPDLKDRLAGVFARGEILGVLMDQDTNVPGVFAPFFGRMAHTPSGAVRLALKNDAPLFVVVNRREGGRIRIFVEGPLAPPLAENEDETLKLCCEKTNEILEAAIRVAPEQWVWFHERWRRRPADRVG